ncbi:MAG: histidinol-phosphate transaminase [Bdellovibrionales bacterium]
MTADFLDRLIRPDLRGLAAYSSARNEAGAMAASIALDANESPWPPFGAPQAKEDQYNRYPDPQPLKLVTKLATLYGMEPDQLFVGRGSDEAIDVLIRLLCRAGQDSILICPPTFGVYQVYARIQGAETIKVPLKSDDGQLDIPGILAACEDTTKLIFIPAPSAPMGHALERKDILSLCEARTEKSLIVIDEAYVEFSPDPDGLSKELSRYHNLVILRTMSKAYALAGERIGCALGQPELIAFMRKIVAPYPLTQSGIRAALDALSPNGLFLSLERRKLIAAERERMAEALTQCPQVVKVFPSVANFLLVQTTDSKAFMAKLARFGIRIRNRSADVPDAVRITIGAPEENDALLKALDIDTRRNSAKATPRLFSVKRNTNETKIDVTINLDNPETLSISTGIGFYDHMLAQIANHGGFGLVLRCKGDLETDPHHTIEDCALALGEALKGALGDKRGIGRYGFSTPLDEALASATIDLSGRPYAIFEGTLPVANVGDMPTEMVPHVFRSLATTLGAAIHVSVKGKNAHHMIEACFKSVGRALRQAIRYEEGNANAIPSTKGVL